MKATERFSISVNPYARALDGSDKLVYSHMVYITKEEPSMAAEDILKQVMKHAVTGHYNGSYHRYCTNPEHAKGILKNNHFKVRPTFAQPEPEELSRAEDEGMIAHPIYQ